MNKVLLMIQVEKGGFSSGLNSDEDEEPPAQSGEKAKKIASKKKKNSIKSKCINSSKFCLMYGLTDSAYISHATG